ncbi:glycerol-3-phosphate dehydrogenase (NAD(P)+) [Actinoplanes octamycinicus]|uniref:Glycerol-3-phosphate dehydrogenase [NAD(P)+] n=1 Tax=Actinoplanes octamycinicus TaxID=135948 RepID=A0A7W7H366_9ACTN|nr:NAD(P)H-dependent glycerol-3-phosphate dehydrogenase [Actinoplanes octamycinicus]MBB4742822.1 glycerol-3-phosphate dehydrogenase (NAD(P)+) [Actinoplanes octamycinicus]GIE58324.1 glycerol-3-phosphate dehydrogenase [NAD(P)+] [Actinoplanes octamycinicus]
MTLRSPSVAVLGGGTWGTVVASITARHTGTVLWLRDPELAATVRETHRNPRYLPEFDLPPTLRATADLAEAVRDADVVFAAVPSPYLRRVLEAAAGHVRPLIPVISLVKGLEQGTRKRMTEVIAEVLPGHPAGVLSGPNIAREIAQGYAAAATLAMPHHHTAQALQTVLNTARYRVYTSDDVIGVEIAGALKNVFAIAVGLGDGLGAGDNTRAMVITRSLHELTRLGTAVGGRPETFAGLAGMGDLIVTCVSPHSRNRHVGVELGRGRPLSQILAAMNQVAEGVKTTAAVTKLAAERGVEMPIAHEVDAVLNHGQPVEQTYRGLLRVIPGHEFYGDTW